jgi:hypothetical protein
MEIKEHPILEKGFEYEIVGFNFQKDIKNEIEPYIDITLQKNEKIRRLRFLSPINIKVENGFHMDYGFQIIDSSDKFLDHKIEVENFETGSIYFRARKVVDLDKITETELEVLTVEFTYKLER